MELSKMEHELNKVWVCLFDEAKRKHILRIMANNPPNAPDIRLSEPADAALIKMCLSYVALKSTYNKLVAAQLQHDHDEPPFTKDT